LDEVSNGALRKEKSLLFAARRSCKLENAVPGEADVVQTVVHKIDARHAAEKTIRWKVQWKDDVPSCSCNALTYSGMPCGHIALYANQFNKQIPLECFHKRFYARTYDDADKLPEDEVPPDEEEEDLAEEFDDYKDVEVGDTDGEEDEDDVLLDSGQDDDEEDDEDYGEDDGEDKEKDKEEEEKQMNEEADGRSDVMDDCGASQEGEQQRNKPGVVTDVLSNLEEEAEVEDGHDERSFEARIHYEPMAIEEDDDSSAQEPQPAEEGVLQVPEMSYEDDVDDQSEMEMTTDTIEDLELFTELKESAEKLLQLYALPDFKQGADNVAIWLSGTIDALASVHVEQTDQCFPDYAGRKRPSTRLRATFCDDAAIKSLCDDLHITGAGLDARFPSTAMCKFRGNLRASILALVEFRRAHVAGIDGVISIFHKKIEDLVAECRQSSESFTASVAQVHGRLNHDSYASVPRTVAEFCRRSQEELEALEQSLRNSRLAKTFHHDMSTDPSLSEQQIEATLEKSSLLDSEEHVSPVAPFTSNSVVASTQDAESPCQLQQTNCSTSDTTSRSGNRRKRPPSSRPCSKRKRRN